MIRTQGECQCGIVVSDKPYRQPEESRERGKGRKAMMRCNGVSNYWYSEGKRYVVADITSGDEPSPFPATGEDVEFLNNDDTLAMGTTIYVVDGAKVYMAKDDNGTFVEQ